MTRNRLAAIGAALIVMTIACGAESPQDPAPTPQDASPSRPAASSEEVARSRDSGAADRVVRPSPEVVALLEPDPDLDEPLSPDEVKATLEAAQGGRTTSRTAVPRGAAPSPDPPSADSPAAPATPAAEEWAKLEDAKKKRIDKWRERLAATTVYVGNDIWYHTGSCPSLTVYQYDLDRVLRPIYIGRPITLKRAAEASMSRHGECSPPTYELE